MLAPEVLNFPAPITTLEVRQGSCLPEDAKWEKMIRDHYFNHKVSAVIPNMKAVPVHLTKILNVDNAYYQVERLRLSEFVKKEFIDTFVKKGKLVALSYKTKVDVDDCVGVLPTGDLYLSLTKDTYQQLGLEGKKSEYDGQTERRFVVTVNLTSPSFVPEKKYYERVKNCFAGDRLDLQFTFILFWEPSEISVCPSTIAKYFSDRNYTVYLNEPTVFQRHDQNILVPLIEQQKTLTPEEAEEFFEWIGYCSLGLEDNEEVSTYQCPEPCQQFSDLCYIQWTGMLSSTRISGFVAALRKFVSQQQDIPWANVTVHGFEDGVVTWKMQEHTFQANGDNFYTCTFIPDNRFITCKFIGSRKKMK